MQNRKPTRCHITLLTIVSFFLALFVHPAPCPAQTQTNKPTDLSDFFRKHWETRVRGFKEQNQAWKHVVLLGDSITEGFDVARYFPGRQIINRGIGADVLGNALSPSDPRGLLRRLDSSVFDCAATDVFVLIGINDLGEGHSLDVICEGYRELLSRIHDTAPSVRVHVQSVLPTRGKYAKHNQPVRELNGRLQKLAEEFGYDYIDLHRLMTDDQGELKAEFTPEGLHLKEPAYRVWRTEILKALHWD